MHKTAAALLGCLSILPAAAMATDGAQSNQKYAVASTNFVDPDDDRLTDRKGNLNDFGFGWQIAGPWYGEARVFVAAFETLGNGPDFYHWGGGFDAQYLIGERGDWAGYLMAGAGLAYNDVQPDALDATGLFVNGGIGVLTPGFTAIDLRLRLQAKAIYDDFEGGQEDYHIGVGLEMPIGRQVVKTVEVERVVEKIVEKIVEKEVKAPPADSDADGVVDGVDQCPGTLRGSTVDATGCAIVAQAVRLDDVNFASGSDRLTTGSFTTLDAAVDAMRGQPGMRVRIVGHTDSTGAAAMNMQLSIARAKAVRQYLVARGIDGARIDVRGYGENRPVASNATVAGRAENRRVEFEVLN